MTALSQSSCEACRVGAPTVDDTEARELLKQIPDWSLIEVDGIKQLQRQYKFKNFVTAMAFANELADISEAEGHHPGILSSGAKPPSLGGHTVLKVCIAMTLSWLPRPIAC